jgi:large subunit ribosomal protein L22
MVEVVAIGKNLRISSKKIRPITEKLRGQKAVVVLESLRFTPKKAAGPLAKVLKSAIANAENNNKLEAEKLIIKEVLVDSGPTLKRWRAGPRGSAQSILKRTSSIRVVLEEK